MVRRELQRLSPRRMRGTLIAVPIVNVLGVMAGDRYLPDRRDLNRSFPGAARGSLAARIAHLMMTQVIARCEVGIDLHTGADRRSSEHGAQGTEGDHRTDSWDYESRNRAQHAANDSTSGRATHATFIIC